ncbi:MAG: ABC transporter permease [Deltaproteobacteria bacterium]|nr:ABC transporter permease [Deltaproteobacteria bacterium]
MKMKWIAFLPLIPLAIAILLIEILTRYQILPSYLAPTPSEVFSAIFVDSKEIWTAFFQTAKAAFLGFLMSAFFGILIGIIFSSSKWMYRAFYPYAVFFQTVPVIAVAPLLVIWFGYGTPTVVASSFIVSIFPMIASTLTGMRSTDPALVDLFHLYKANAFDFLFKLRLPFCLPQIFVGLRIASGLAVIGAVVGEFITGGGLGGIIEVAKTRQRLDLVFAAILMATLIGFIFLSGMNIFSRLVLRNWHASEKNI